MKTDATHLSFYSLAVLIALALEACGTGGHLVTKDQIDQVKIGVSTKEHVQMILGNPKSIISSDSSTSHPETWIYTYAKYASDPHTSVPPIGVTSFPISRNRRRADEIEIRFDKNGVVTVIQERQIP